MVQDEISRYFHFMVTDSGARFCASLRRLPRFSTLPLSFSITHPPIAVIGLSVEKTEPEERNKNIFPQFPTSKPMRGIGHFMVRTIGRLHKNCRINV